MTARTMMTPTSFAPYPWMRFALQELGQAEQPGPAQNHRILQYQLTTGHTQDEDVPWCSSFANWCMRQVGVLGTGQPNARSWLTWGDGLPTTAPCYGCITIFSRPPKPWNGHVGFYVGQAGGDIWVVGGNQHNGVRLLRYPWTRWLGFRWPAGISQPQ